MTETELVTWIMSKAEAFPLLVLVVWAEVRFLPLVLDAIGWNRAVGAKVGVTEAEALAQRPPSTFARLFRRPPNGGPPAAAVVALLLVAVLLAACVPVEAIDQSAEQAEITHGNALDPHGELPLGARQSEADTSRAWRAQYRLLTGEDDVPGADAWEPLPPELDPVRAPEPEHRCPEYFPVGDELGAGDGHCGCGATSCVMPCTGCCPGGCVCAQGPPTGAR